MKPTRLLKIGYLFIFILVSSTLISTSGCAPITAIATKLTFLPAVQSETDIPRLEDKIKTDTDLSSKAKSLLDLSLLYSNQNNPNPDYPKALKALEEFSLLDLKNGEADSVQFLKSLLQKIVKTENNYAKSKDSVKKLNNKIKKSNNKIKKLNSRIKKLKQSTEKSKIEYDTLARENQEKKEKLEKLMHLDIQLNKIRQEMK